MKYEGGDIAVPKGPVSASNSTAKNCASIANCTSAWAAILMIRIRCVPVGRRLSQRPLGGSSGMTERRSHPVLTMTNLLDLTGRVAVVIGATSGIGRAIAIALAQHGADVIPTGRRQERVERACEEIEALGRRTLALTANVAHRGSIDVLRDTVLGQFGRVDILVNAAGFTFRKPTIEVSEEQWIGLMDTNLNGPLRACQSFYEPLKASGRGRIINIASLGSYLGFHEVTAYCASKSALLSLTRSLAVEWARDGIMVNAIAPGIFPTEMTSNDRERHAAGAGVAVAHADAPFWQAGGSCSARRCCWHPTAPVLSRVSVSWLTEATWLQA